MLAQHLPIRQEQEPEQEIAEPEHEAEEHNDASQMLLVQAAEKTGALPSCEGKAAGCSEKKGEENDEMTAAAGEATAADERRVDPGDGNVYTWEELSAFYQQMAYTAKEIEDHWETCKPARQWQAHRPVPSQVRSRSRAWRR